MPCKKHRPEEIIGKLREAEVVLAQGATTEEAWRPSPAASKIDVRGFPVCRFACAHAR